MDTAKHTQTAEDLVKESVENDLDCYLCKKNRDYEMLKRWKTHKEEFLTLLPCMQYRCCFPVRHHYPVRDFLVCQAIYLTEKRNALKMAKRANRTEVVSYLISKGAK